MLLARGIHDFVMSEQTRKAPVIFALLGVGFFNILLDLLIAKGMVGFDLFFYPSLVIATIFAKGQNKPDTPKDETPSDGQEVPINPFWHKPSAASLEANSQHCTAEQRYGMFFVLLIPFAVLAYILLH